jgi:hydroxymethylpyrimidine/phosphomethylpyrimidine kinase
MTATTALTAQNTTGVDGIHQVPPEFTRKQIDVIFRDIRPSVVKTGALNRWFVFLLRVLPFTD